MTLSTLADHTLLLALPAFAPAVVVVGVVIWVAMRDRRADEDGVELDARNPDARNPDARNPDARSADATPADEDGPP